MKLTMKSINTSVPKHNQWTLLLMFILSLLIYMMTLSNATAAEHCSDNFYIDETLKNGARWDMCWDHRQREGIIFHHIYYTPNTGKRRMVLSHAAVAQIHVPYDDSGARFHDVSDFGIGHSGHQHFSDTEEDTSVIATLLGVESYDSSMLDLKKKDCPNGNLLKWTEVNVLCQQIESRDVAYKTGDHSSRGNNLSLFSVSEVGAYYYIPTWRFFDDGTIEPWIGATGALQRFSSDKDRGWKMGDGRIGVAHLHNFFWKLDFDLNGTSDNDVVEEINFPLVKGKRLRSVTQFDREAARKVSPDNMRHWRIRDGTAKNSNNHSISYDIVLNETGHQDIGPEHEPFTHNDFYVTKQNDDERFASHNPKGGKNLAEFTNNENLVNQDIVIWAGITFYHMPRSEDAPHMDAHWSHMQLIPRDWHASNPSGKTEKFNTSPRLTSPENQTSQEKSVVNLAIQASDVDNDELVYSATGLPEGLLINEKTGVISGALVSVGDHAVEVMVSDNKESKTVAFNWVVIGVNKAPLLTALDDQSGVVGESVTLSVLASDGDNDKLFYTAIGLPSGLIINSTSGVISGSLREVGNYTIDLKVSDDESNDTKRFAWLVSKQNTLPVATTQQVSVKSGASVNVTLNASDEDNDPLSYEIKTQPAHGTLSGTPPNLMYAADASYTGSDSFTFKVNDGTDDSSVATVALVVSSANDKLVEAETPGQDEATGSTAGSEIVIPDESVQVGTLLQDIDQAGIPPQDSVQAGTLPEDTSQVSNEATGTPKSGGGLFPLEWLMLLSFMSLLRLRHRNLGAAQY